MVNNDERLTLSNVVKYGASTTQSWTTDPKGSRMFADFPDASLEAMATQEILLQAHDWVVSTDTFVRTPLKDFFTLLATDHKGEGEDRVDFVMAMEAKEYPIYAVMFHPETANRHVTGNGTYLLAGKVNNAVTDEINFRFS